MKKHPFVLFLLLFFLMNFPADAQTESDWAKLGEDKIYFQTAGSPRKKALIFVHGWACSLEFWEKSIEAFPEYRDIAVDLPGHGKSDKPPKGYTMEHFAKAVGAVMKKAKVEKAVLAGHSMGTPVIRQFYRLYPEKVSGLVIVDGTLRSFGSKEESEAFIAPLRADYETNSAKFIDGMIQPIGNERLKNMIRKRMLATPKHVGLGAMEGMIDARIWKNDKINVPVLAILAKSAWWAEDEEENFRKIAPNLEFRMWEGVSHFLMLEKPLEFNGEIREFVSKNKLL